MHIYIFAEKAAFERDTKIRGHFRIQSQGTFEHEYKLKSCLKFSKITFWKNVFA